MPAPLKPPVIRVPARTRETVERMCHVFAANLANCIVQGVEKQLNAELAAAVEPPKPAPAVKLSDLGELNGAAFLKL